MDRDTHNKSFKVNMRRFEGGVYIVQVMTKTRVITEKIVVAL